MDQKNEFYKFTKKKHHTTRIHEKQANIISRGTYNVKEKRTRRESTFTWEISSAPLFAKIERKTRIPDLAALIQVKDPWTAGTNGNGASYIRQCLIEITFFLYFAQLLFSYVIDTGLSVLFC